MSLRIGIPQTKNNTVIMSILFIELFNYDIGSVQILYWTLTIGCSLVLIIQNNSKLLFKLNAFWNMYVSFLIICLASLLWSIDRETSIDYLESLIVNFIVLFSIYSTVKSTDDIKNILIAMVASVFFNAIYLIIKIDWKSVGLDRIGVEYTGRGWNANALGLMMVWGIAITAGVLEIKRKIIKFLLIAPMLFLLFFSGSRKAWLAFVLVLGTIIFLKNKRKVFRNIIVFVIIAGIAVYLVINVKFLYKLGGYRFEQLVLGFLGKGQIDHSSYLRQEYARLGIEWFRKRPFFGFGINCYRKLLLGSSFATNTYAHNNYVELLVDVGIFGTVVFYSYYIWSIITGLKCFIEDYKRNTKASLLIVFLLCLIIIQLIMQIGMVSYIDLPSMIILLVFCCSVNIRNPKQLKQLFN